MGISYKDEHDRKWVVINLRLNIVGYWVKWQPNLMTAEKDYAIGRGGEVRPMGVFSGEDSAMAVIKMILEGVNEQEGD